MNKNDEPIREGQSSSDKSTEFEYANKKGKILESDIHESIAEEKRGWKKNGSITEATTSTSEKEKVTAKTRVQAVKVRQTYSGPLMPGSVLTHSASERGRISERLIIKLYLFFSFCFLSLFSIVTSVTDDIKKILSNLWSFNGD